jgi:Fanconi anemia group M protein
MNQIFDIFSKSKKERKEEKPKIVMDYREKNSMVYSELINLGIDVEVKELKVADYIVKDVAIERKTVSDFISSMINKRLTNQLDGLQQYKNRLLLIEGIDKHELYSHEIPEQGIHPNAIRGFLLSIIFEHKTPIIFTKDAEDTAKFISILAKREKKEASLNVSKSNLDKKERMQFILEGFPGIGPKTAKKLLAHFKTLKEIFQASIEELKEVIGVKAEIFKLIEEKY